MFKVSDIFLHHRRDFKSLISTLSAESAIIETLVEKDTLVEKLQTIVTKFRLELTAKTGGPKVNFMRQYYDVYKLLQLDDIQKFIATEEYQDHKQYWFSDIDLDVPLAKKEAFLLSDPVIREDFRSRYTGTEGLYYRGQPDFDEMLLAIQAKLGNL